MSSLVERPTEISPPGIPFCHLPFELWLAFKVLLIVIFQDPDEHSLVLESYTNFSVPVTERTAISGDIMSSSKHTSSQELEVLSGKASAASFLLSQMGVRLF